VELTVTGRHIEITDAMKAYAEEKLGKLPHFYDRIENVEVILDRLAAQYRVEVVVRADHKHTFVGQTDADEFNEAVDLVFDKMERQMTKHKERVRNRKHAVKPEEMQSPGGEA
jgi:putative sigma-54 modulation protein